MQGIRGKCRSWTLRGHCIITFWWGLSFAFFSSSGPGLAGVNGSDQRGAPCPGEDLQGVVRGGRGCGWGGHLGQWKRWEFKSQGAREIQRAFREVGQDLKSVGEGMGGERDRCLTGQCRLS